MYAFILHVTIALALFIASNILWRLYNWRLRDTKVNCSLALHGIKRSRPLPPGSYGLPFIGETYLFILFKLGYFEYMRRRYGPIYHTHLFGKPTIRTTEAIDIQFVLKDNGQHVTASWPRSTHALLKGGLALETSETLHKTKRKAVLKAFSHEALSCYVPVIFDICDSYVNRWNVTSCPVYLYPELRTLAFHVACRCLFGISPSRSDLSRFMDLFKDYVNGMFCVPLNIPGSTFHKAIKARHTLLDKVNTLLQEQNGTNTDKGRCTVLNQLKQASVNGCIPLKDVDAICLELLFAGHETTASAATTMVINVCKHPRVFDGVKLELKNAGMYETKVTYAAINGMPYIGSVVKETLRLNPPIGAGYRRVVNTLVCQGYQIPKGWTLIYGIRESHKHSRIVSSSGRFMPERWVTNGNKLADDFLAFGTGRRKCVGRHFAELFLKVFLAVLAQRCRVTLVNEKVELDTFPVPHPVDDLPVTFKPAHRENNI